MRILLDVDGVLADFVGSLIRAAHLSIKPEEVVQWQLLDLLAPAERKHAETVLNEPPFWMEMATMPGAEAGVAALRAAGHELVVVTAPWYGCPGWDAARRWWLQKRFGFAPRDAVLTERKDLVRGDALIDDKLAHVQAWDTANDRPPHGTSGAAYLYTLPHNAAEAWPARVTWATLPANLIGGGR